MIDALDAQSAGITAQLRRYARRQPGCRALMGRYGVGERALREALPEQGLLRSAATRPGAVGCPG